MLVVVIVVVGVVGAVVDAPEDIAVVVSKLSEPEDTIYEEEVVLLGLFFEGPLTLRSMKSDIKPGFVIFLS